MITTKSSDLQNQQLEQVNNNRACVCVFFFYSMRTCFLLSAIICFFYSRCVFKAFVRSSNLISYIFSFPFAHTYLFSTIYLFSLSFLLSFIPNSDKFINENSKPVAKLFITTQNKEEKRSHAFLMIMTFISHEQVGVGAQLCCTK